MTRTNKKKRGGGGKSKAERSAAIVARRDGGPGFFDSLPSFPGPESYDHMLERIIGYELVSTTDGVPCRVSRDEDGTVAVREVLTGDPVPFPSTLVPNYRGEATYPVARDLIERVQVDCSYSLSRRVKKYINDVPAGELEVFTKFMERGANIHVKCGKYNGIDSYACRAELLGKDEQSFFFACSPESHAFAFTGCLSRCLMKYKRDLALLLIYECLARICAGTAEFVESGITPTGPVDVISKALRVMFVENSRFSDLIGVYSFLLDWAIKRNACLHETAGWQCGLGEALEAKGFHEQAALVYAEAGRHLHLAKHPKTYSFMVNAGLASKRHGDYETAEYYYCLALQSLSFECEHDEYKKDVFHALTNLFLMYYDVESTPLNLLATLAHLLCASGGDPGGDIKRSSVMNTRPLKAVYKNASEEQMCRVLQSIIEKATSVSEMRAAILGCCDPRVAIIDMGTKTGARNTRESKDHARNFLRGGDQRFAGYIACCSACGERKQEKKLLICVCSSTYYCDKACQKDHWPQHKPECTAIRKVKMQKDKGGESSGDSAGLGVEKLKIG